MSDDEIKQLREVARLAKPRQLYAARPSVWLALLSRLESAERERDEARADMHAAWKSAHDNAAKFVDAEAERDALADLLRRARVVVALAVRDVADMPGEDGSKAKLIAYYAALVNDIDTALAAKEQSK
jgi:hypothetical protein